MKNKRLSNKERLLHTQKAIQDIERFMNGIDEHEFVTNELIHNAVLMQFIIIEESIAHVEDAFIEQYEYPWYRVKSFRNIVVHEYFNIKLSAVWGIIVNDLSELSLIIDRIIKTEF